jgi:hypothetical protein
VEEEQVEVVLSRNTDDAEAETELLELAADVDADDGLATTGAPILSPSVMGVELFDFHKNG